MIEANKQQNIFMEDNNMASIQKRSSNYSVIYNSGYPTNKQVWESGYETHEDAQERKREVENLVLQGKHPKSSQITVSQFCAIWLPIHAQANWQFGTYSSAVGCLGNHVLPYIGDMKLCELTPLHTEQLIGQLYSSRKKIYAGKNNQEARYGEYLSSTTIRLVYLLLHQMMGKAVEWYFIDSNPVRCKVPARDTTERAIWTPDMFDYALQNIHDPVLHLIIHMLFACTLRIGELLAITIDDVNLRENKIRINKTLQRVTASALNMIPHQSIVKHFPTKLGGNSKIILKKPKTKASIRTIYLTQPLANEIEARIRQIQSERAFYKWNHDNNLLFSLPEAGDPIEAKLCAKWFSRWQKEHAEQEFPFITFHNIRHSSSTYKLLISNGDIKSVQGDTGHSSSDMLLNLYTHIQDSQRIKLTNIFEDTFYKQ